MNHQKAASYSSDWQKREEIAELMIPLIGKLYRDRGVVITVYDRSLVHKSPIEILKTHRFTRHVLQEELPVDASFAVLQVLSQLDLVATKIDLGKLAAAYHEQESEMDVGAFLQKALPETQMVGENHPDRPQDVVLYGFGRVGRMVARIMIEGSSNGWNLRAIVSRGTTGDELLKRASLLRRDSVHGKFDGTIVMDREENALVVNGRMIYLIHADTPEDVDYSKYGIQDAIVIDNTGVWRDREGLERHLKSPGVSKVVLTAPGEADVPNIVYGVNHTDIPEKEGILSAASCTTNAIVPVLKAMHTRFDIDHGHIETCHSYTNDQNLTDNYHKKSRRGRAAPLNMVITETAAASAAAKVLPELSGKLTANAIRVPTPNVSLAILNLTLGQESTVEEVNTYLRDISLNSPLQGQIDYTSSPEVVSSDFVGTLKTAIVDSFATIVRGKHCVLYVWYDNEYGYAHQVVRIVQHVGRPKLSVFP